MKVLSGLAIVPFTAASLPADVPEKDAFHEGALRE